MVSFLRSLRERWRPASPSPSDMQLSTRLRAIPQEDIQVFQTRRTVDHSGVSGVGLVAHGVAFTDGLVLLRWHGELTSLAIYRNVARLEDIHGYGGDTEVEWLSTAGAHDHYHDIGEIILAHSALTQNLPWFAGWV